MVPKKHFTLRNAHRDRKTSEAQRELSISYIKLGDILKKHGKLYEAEQWYYKSLTIFKMLAKESKTANNRRDLSRVYEK